MIIITVSDSTAVQAAIEKIAGDFGRIDVFVANAGMIANENVSPLDPT